MKIKTAGWKPAFRILITAAAIAPTALAQCTVQPVIGINPKIENGVTSLTSPQILPGNEQDLRALPDFLQMQSGRAYELGATNVNGALLQWTKVGGLDFTQPPAARADRAYNWVDQTVNAGSKGQTFGYSYTGGWSYFRIIGYNGCSLPESQYVYARAFFPNGAFVGGTPGTPTGCAAAPNVVFPPNNVQLALNVSYSLAVTGCPGTAFTVSLNGAFYSSGNIGTGGTAGANFSPTSPGNLTVSVNVGGQLFTQNYTVAGPATPITPGITLITNVFQITVNSTILVNITNVNFPGGITGTMTCSAGFTTLDTQTILFDHSPFALPPCRNVTPGVPVVIVITFGGYPPIVLGTFTYIPVGIVFFPTSLSVKQGDVFTGWFSNLPAGATSKLNIVLPDGTVVSIDYDPKTGGYLIPATVSTGRHQAFVFVLVGSVSVRIDLAYIDILPSGILGTIISGYRYVLTIEGLDTPDGAKPFYTELQPSGYIKVTLDGGKKYKMVAVLPDGSHRIRTTGYFLLSSSGGILSSTDAADPNYFCSDAGRTLLVTFVRPDTADHDVAQAFEMNFADTGAPVCGGSVPQNPVTIQAEGDVRPYVGEKINVSLRQGTDVVKTLTGLWVVTPAHDVIMLGDSDGDFVREYVFPTAGTYIFFGWSQRDGFTSIHPLEIVVGTL